jgi:hypothetical protein
VDHNWITLSGSELGPVSEFGTNSHVYFAGVAATDYDTGSSTDHTEIVCKVPSSATGMTVNVYIAVAENDSGNQSFTLLPHLDSISVSQGNTGDTVTLSGTNFGSAQGSGSVSVSGVSATISSWANDSVEITIPAAALDGAIQLERSDAETTNTLDFDVVPTITGFDFSRREEGQDLTINGSGFGSSRAAGGGSSTVTFDGGGGTPVSTYVSWATGQLVVTVPDGALSGTVTVAIDDGDAGANDDDATSSSTVSIVLPPPSLEDIDQI